jgi:hypothetical protein
VDDRVAELGDHAQQDLGLRIAGRGALEELIEGGADLLRAASEQVGAV